MTNLKICRMSLIIGKVRFSQERPNGWEYEESNRLLIPRDEFYIDQEIENKCNEGNKKKSFNSFFFLSP